jgi:phage tail sheath protein FI
MFTQPPILELQRELVSHCERFKNRVAILDTRLEDVSPQAVVAWRHEFDSTYAALYWPWLRVPDPFGAAGALLAVPPSGHVAGIYARVETAVGAHKPPANELLETARDVTAPVDDILHGYLNDNRVNVIRAVPGRGLRVAGARTLSSDTDWMYINVRRLLIMIERAIDAQTQWLVFEPNNPGLWRDVERVVRSFLNRIWQQGMLEGATAEQAFQVTCDETSNPTAESEAGRLITLVGVQPPWPAEFVVVRIGKTESGIEIL